MKFVKNINQYFKNNESKILKERGLPLNISYALIDKQYIPLESGYGCICDNCGKLIANIATVKNSNGDSFSIGFDCLETILINNSLLSTNDIKEYEYTKSMIPKIIRFSKKIKEAMHNNIGITGIKFEKPTYNSEWIEFYWLLNNESNSRNNDSVKLKDVDFDFLIKTLKNIFPKIKIITN